MNYSQASLPELVAACDTMFTNALNTPDILEALAPYGYDAHRIDDLGELVDDVEGLDADQQREYGEQFAATAAANTAVTLAETTWVRHRKLSRVAHRRGTPGYRALGLVGTVPQDDQQMLSAAEGYYRVLGESPDLQTSVAGVNVTAAEVERGRAQVEAARAALAAQQKETGEAQQATRSRDDRVAVLRAAAHDFAEVAKVALEDTPQRREVLGLLERS